MPLPTDVDLTTLSVTYVQGALKNEKSHLDWLDAEINALEAERAAHQKDAAVFYAELVRRNAAPYRVYLVKLELTGTEVKTHVEVPSTFHADNAQAIGAYLTEVCQKRYGSAFKYVRGFYDIHWTE